MMLDVTYEQLLELYEVASTYVSCGFVLGLYIAIVLTLLLGVQIASIIFRHWRA